MRMRQAARSDTGKVREHNEDSYLVRAPVFAVADGMGGHEAGEVASSVSLSVFEDAVPDETAPANWMTEILERANAAVYEAGTHTGGMLRMGTTLTAAYVTADSVWLGHVGDSRAYLLRDTELRQLTDDHSLVAEWVRDGRLTAEEAALHPQRSVITRALGIEPDVQIDVSRITPQQGDRILLCSDGLTGELSDAEICGILREEVEPETAAQVLVDTANDHGGEDNITVVVIDFLDDPLPATPGIRPEPQAAPSPAEDETAPATATEPVASPPRAEGSPGLVVRDLPSEGRAEGRGEARGADESAGVPGGRRFWIRFGMWAALTLVIVLGGWIGLNWYISSSWYVGVHDGNVTVFQGVPEGVLGMSTGRVWDRTSLPVTLLPTTTREKVEAGIAADSREDAEEIVANLREQAMPTTTTTTTPTTTTTTPTMAPLPPTPGAPPP
ncbi:MAG: Stp1/IreP family PP2C-type Ser/Thr phosphatase [Acidimicrobiia bacterium]|nr:Stp1/IreP family PP2C-type Ser/Thr phosphatase [Acidimicrobiia bacterium]